MKISTIFTRFVRPNRVEVSQQHNVPLRITFSQISQHTLVNVLCLPVWVGYSHPCRVRLSYTQVRYVLITSGAKKSRKISAKLKTWTKLFDTRLHAHYETFV